jgi:hypothetical protein
LTRFVAQWLHVDTDLLREDPDFETSPDFLELLALVENALAEHTPVTDFIAGERGFVHRDNLDAYGLDELDGSGDVVPVDWPAGSGRRGVLAQELMASSTRHPDQSRRPIFRGLLVRRSLLCDRIAAPSAELVALAGEVGDRTEDARCKGCHQSIDPIGHAFAVLDPDIDDPPREAEVLAHDELAGTYADLSELLGAVAASRAFAECFARHWLSFFLEQPLNDVDAAWAAALADAVQAGASLDAIVERTATELYARAEVAVPWCAGE